MGVEKKKHKPKILDPVKLSFKGERKKRDFSDKQKLGEFIAIRLACSKA